MVSLMRGALDGNICGSYENGASVQCNAGTYVIVSHAGTPLELLLLILFKLLTTLRKLEMESTGDPAFQHQSLVVTGELFTFAGASLIAPIRPLSLKILHGIFVLSIPQFGLALDALDDPQSL
jgi:hypothetical protein